MQRNNSKLKTMTMTVDNTGRLEGIVLPEPKMVFELVIRRTGHFFLHKDSLPDYPANFLDTLRNKGYTIYNGKDHLKICG